MQTGVFGRQSVVLPPVFPSKGQKSVAGFDRQRRMKGQNSIGIPGHGVKTMVEGQNMGQKGLLDSFSKTNTICFILNILRYLCIGFQRE
jgi:hypothetical protein